MLQHRPESTNIAGKKQKVVTPGNVRKILPAQHHSERIKGKKEYSTKGDQAFKSSDVHLL